MCLSLRSLIFVFSYIILGSYSSITYQQNVKAVRVSVEQGILEGELLMTVSKDTLYYSFKGIPYAAPPIKELRFQPPQPPACWTGIRNATQHGSICIQADFFTDELLPSSEDCLYLNVYTTKIMPDVSLAVMIYIHGGGFNSGSGNDDNYGPDFFMKQDIVLVTINYRLGALGFLSLGSKELPGNAGMKDQVAALKWVQQNIAKFGGNPGKVTIFGDTSGGISCLLHAISPMSKGLFQRAIAMSGIPLLDYVLEFEPARRAYKLGKIMGYETENSTALFKFFQTASAYRFVNTKPHVIIAEYFIHNIVKMHNYVPIAEKDFAQERFLLEPPIDSLINGRINDVDLILGFSDAEGLSGIPYFEESIISIYNRYPELLNPRRFLYYLSPNTYLDLSDAIKANYFGERPISIETMPEAVNYFTDTYIFQTLRYTRDVSFAYRKRKFLYRFSGVSERNVYGNAGLKYGLTGAGQLDIELYLFQANKFNLTINTNSISYKIINQITTLFANFAKYGNPTPDRTLGVKWEQYNATAQSYLDIGAVLKPLNRPAQNTMSFWKSIYELTDIPFYHVLGPK